MRSKKSGDFMVHLHGARKRHYDLRLQWKGVLKCWAIPKGPSSDPKDKRLAVRTEDHPDDYKAYEGVIPEKSYGAGPSLIWDAGEFISLEDFEKGLKNGHLRFATDGVRMKGAWNLVLMNSKQKKQNWLLIKEDDEFANACDMAALETSVATGRTLKNLENDEEPEESIVELPSTIKPQLAVLSEKIPNGDWIFERKYDGYRILAKIENNDVSLQTRNGKEWSEKFSSVCNELKASPFDQIILDGEVVHFDTNDKTDFSALQNYKNNKKLPLDYVVFDVLYAGGVDLQNVPLVRRREFLEELFKSNKSERIHLSKILDSKKDLLAEACEKEWEGLIAKQPNSIYHNARHGSWLKIKCTDEEEFVVIGMTEPEGSRSHFGSLLLAENINGRLVYRGRVGTGLNEATLKSLNNRFTQHLKGSPPNVKSLGKQKVKSWLEPHFYIQVSYSEKTKDGILRHPVYKGLREDKEFQTSTKSEAVKFDKTQSRAESTTKSTVELTHPKRLLFEKEKISKLDLWKYYEKIWSHFVKWSAHHPLSLLRCPSGIGKQCFFQKHLESVDPPPQIEIKEKTKKDNYSYIEKPDDLKALVQLSAIELHTWNSQVDDVEHPLYAVFDLDPGKGVQFKQVIKAAKDIRKILKSFDKESYVRTSGGKGLHVLTNVNGMSWKDAFEFSKAVAHYMVELSPDSYVATMSKAKRENRIFIDYFRNKKGSTSIATFSVRARKGAPVATPLAWSELNKNFDPKDYNIKTIPERLGKLRGDPWEAFYNEL